MNISHIVEALKLERHRLDAAISALTGIAIGNGRRSVRHKAINMISPAKSKRRLSRVARKRLSVAAKARWVKAKRAGKNSL